MFGIRKQKTGKGGGEPVDIDMLIAAFGQGCNFWGGQPNADILSRARLADGFRDASWQPVAGSQFSATWQKFNEAQQERFCVLADGVVLPPVISAFGKQKTSGSDAVFTQLKKLATSLELLTLEVLQQSDVRLEEFARHFCAEFGLAIDGETSEVAAARLHDIDFARLMKEAETARNSAADRMAYLRELQEKENESRRPRRGKW